MKNNFGAPLASLALAAACATLATPAQALDATWSGFATLGYARSDSEITYQRVIDENGTFRRDSLLAGQVDLRLSPQWSGTVQLKVAPADDEEDAWRAKAAWAFVGWRPNDDWLLRAGKMRLPLYLYSESLDIGVARDMARMPHELYSLTTTNDFTGLFVTRSFAWGTGDIAVDAYTGNADLSVRLWMRDGVPPSVPPGASYSELHAKITGLVLTSRDPGLTWRLGVHHTTTRAGDSHPMPVRYPRVDLAPGVGYWKVNDAQPGPPIERKRDFDNLTMTVGAEWQFGSGWRVAGEAVRIRQFGTELGYSATASYLALFKRIGAYTPYVSVARQRSSDRLLEWHRRLSQDTVPATVPGAALANAAQRAAADALYVSDQRSLSLGASYAYSPTAKLSGEWTRTKVGATSRHFDVPPGHAGVQGLRVQTLTLNVSVAF